MTDDTIGNVPSSSGPQKTHRHSVKMTGGHQAGANRLMLDVGRLVRLEAAPLSVPESLAGALDPDYQLIGYHHCPSLCQCARASLYIFGLDASPFHRCLAAKLLDHHGLRALLDRKGALKWLVEGQPPAPLHLSGLGEEIAGDIKDEAQVRKGWLIPTYGPYSRKGFFLLECKKESAFTVLPAQLSNELTSFHGDISRKLAMADRRAELTQREIDVTRWIVYGKTNPVIAEILDLSAHTVNGYLRRIYLKTGTADRVSLAIYAVNHGIV